MATAAYSALLTAQAYKRRRAMPAISWEVEIKTSKTIYLHFMSSDITHVAAERMPHKTNAVMSRRHCIQFRSRKYISVKPNASVNA